MNFNPLDNHGRRALNSHHRHPVIRGKIAAHYPQDVLFGAVMPEYNPAGFILSFRRTP